MKDFDPLQIDQRLYRQCGALLDRLESGEKVSITMHYGAVKTIAQIRILQLTLRTKTEDPEHVGSAVRKYASTFAQDGGARRTAKRRRSDPVPAELVRGIFADDDDPDAA